MSPLKSQSSMKHVLKGSKSFEQKRDIVVDASAKIQKSLGTLPTKPPTLSGKDEAKLKRLLSSRDVHIIVDSSWTPLRSFLASIVISNRFENFMGTVILSQFCFAILEVDRAAQEEEVPAWLSHVMHSFLIVYLMELSMRFYVLRCSFFESKTNWLDFVVVVIDCCMAVVEVLAGSLPSVAIFRIFRLTRLLRAFRVLTTFRELYIMIHCFVGAMKAIFWATLMIFVVLTLWSILAVEFLHPLNMKLADAGVHGDCERCANAYESVMKANLTFFQQIIAGDSWGTITIPMIEMYPWTCTIYFPAYVTIGMGLVNLILTVIVDRADQAKKENEQEKLNLKLEAVKMIFNQMDKDSSGDVSMTEFTEGIENSAEMRHALELLGVHVEDLSTVFMMMDYDGSGTVSCEEFVENLSRMKTEDSFMVLLFVKHFMTTLEKQIDDHVDSIKKAVSDSHSSVTENATVEMSETPKSTHSSHGSATGQLHSLPPSISPLFLPPDALKQDIERLCKNTEALLVDTLELITQKLDEHCSAQKKSIDYLVSLPILPGPTVSTRPTADPWSAICGGPKGKKALVEHIEADARQNGASLPELPFEPLVVSMRCPPNPA